MFWKFSQILRVRGRPQKCPSPEPKSWQRPCAIGYLFLWVHPSFPLQVVCRVVPSEVPPRRSTRMVQGRGRGQGRRVWCTPPRSTKTLNRRSCSWILEKQWSSSRNTSTRSIRTSLASCAPFAISLCAHSFAIFTYNTYLSHTYIYINSICKYYIIATFAYLHISTIKHLRGQTCENLCETVKNCEKY